MATQLIGTGYDIRAVSRRLGRAQASTTLDTYAAFLTANQPAALLDPDGGQ